MPSSLSRRYRQYAGLALVILAYLGGIAGWSWAVSTVESSRSAAPDTVQTVTPSPEPARPATDDAGPSAASQP